MLPNYVWHAHWPAAAFLALFVFVALRAPGGRSVVVLTFAVMTALLFALCSWIPLHTHNNWQFSGYTWMYFLSFYIVMIVPIYHRRSAPPGVAGSRVLAGMRVLLGAVAFVWAVAGTTLDFHLARERHLFIARIRDALADVTPPVYLLDSQFSTNRLLRENDLTLWDDSLLVSSYDGPQNACMIIPPYGWKDGLADLYRVRYMRPLNPAYFDIPNATINNAHRANSAADSQRRDRGAGLNRLHRTSTDEALARTIIAVRLNLFTPCRYASKIRGRTFHRASNLHLRQFYEIPVSFGYCWTRTRRLLPKTVALKTSPLMHKSSSIPCTFKMGIPSD